MCAGGGDGDEQGDVLGIPFGTPGTSNAVRLRLAGIIFGNLSHQCAQIVGGTADLLGFGSAVRQVIDIMPSCRLQELGWLSSPGSFSRF